MATIRYLVNDVAATVDFYIAQGYLEIARDTTCSAWPRTAGLQVTFICAVISLAFTKVVPR